MIILEKYKLLQKLVGLNSDGGCEKKILQILYLVTLNSFLLIELIFIILNIRNGIDQAAAGLAPMCGVLPAILSYEYLLINRERYYSLLMGMQVIVNESELYCNFASYALYAIHLKWLF